MTRALTEALLSVSDRLRGLKIKNVTLGQKGGKETLYQDKYTKIWRS